MSDPRLYFACLAAYNAGHLHGAWIDFYSGITPEEVEEAITAMIKASPAPDAEEWAIHDHEGFAGVDSCNVEVLCQVAELIHTYQEGAVKGFIGHVGSSNLVAEIDNFSDIYVGCFKSETDFCEQNLGIAEAAEQIQVFDWATLDQYIDWERIANDAFINCYYSHKEAHEEVHVYARQ